MKYTKREAEETILRLLKVFPVVGITGPRQSGKSTLLRHLLQDYEYVTFDDVRKIQLFEDDPIGFIERYNHKVIFDEVHVVPEIFSTIKFAVDKDRQNYGNFVLTGSSQFSFLKKASESVAGRIGLLSLLPFQYTDVADALLQESIFHGSYPELVMRNYEESDFWYSSYVDTYLNKDIRVLAQIGDMRDFRRFVQLLASDIAHTLEFSRYAKDIGVSVPTIKRWISILEASYIVFLVPPFYNNFGKRIVKSPKLYFYDTGLVSYFTGITTYKQYDQGPLGGPLFENYVVSEIYKKILHKGSNAQLYYFRTQDRSEIDLIVDLKTHKELIEIKKSATFKTNMCQTLLNYREEGDKTYLLYQGEKDHYKDVSILPIGDYLGAKKS